MLGETSLELKAGDGRLELLLPDDVPEVLDLYRRCEDYFLLQDGEPAMLADAEELFTDVPPGKRPDDQFVLGARRNGRLDALSLLLSGYPNPDDWYLGFLLVDPAIRGQGFGRAVYRETERWAAARGARRMLIAVLEENEPALRFWRALGFEQLRVTPRATFKHRSHVRFEMGRIISELPEQAFRFACSGAFTRQ